MIEEAEPCPKIVIGGTVFYVDLKHREFRQADNIHNTIPFSKMLAVKDGNVIMYDPVTKNAFIGTIIELMRRDDVFKIKLPSSRKMDPVGYERLFPLDTISKVNSRANINDRNKGRRRR